MPSLRQLRYFEAVARLGHFGKAAEHCSVSQPALSAQIRDFEDEVGVPLIERNARGAELTEAGREVAERAGRILAHSRDMLDSAHKYRPTLAGELKLGIIPSMAPYLLPGIMDSLEKSYPECRLRICETLTDNLIDKLSCGEIDLCLLALPIEHVDVASLDLYEDRFVLAYPHGDHEPEVQTTTDFSERHHLLLLEDGHCFRDQALDACEIRKIGKIDPFGVSALSTVVQMVSAGMGMTLLPEMTLHREVAKGEVSLKSFDDPAPSRRVGLVWRTSSPRKADFEAFGQLVIDSKPPANLGS